MVARVKSSFLGEIEMNHSLKAAIMAGMLITSGTAQAANISLNLTGQVANFTNSQFVFAGLNFDNYYLSLDGFGSPVSVAQGDTIDATITLDQSYTVQASQVRTDVLQYFFGQNFTGNGTDVSGVFDFYDGATLVHSIGYSSSTASALASFGILFPPSNGAFTFDRLVNNVTIDTLDQPALLDSSALRFSLVSNLVAVPEPATWAMMLAGFGFVGGAMRRRTKFAVTYA
jgi:hypothetical protein